MKNEITTQAQARAAFWDENPSCAMARKPGGQNKQITDVRVAFIDWLDNAHREGRMSDKLAQRLTL